ncbi:hypothetical protein MLD38_038514 [Melastoma candidum]|uniref:Uncharacterized protein n=1 Tax=Melastoma candidum TaxID=119954 RepID=A0ACB9L0M3_9MYRT|nr:hypothetical protein MLD38_038514 [Melastoma candidum]
MVETRFEELRREQETTGELVEGLVEKIGVLTTQMREVQLQTRSVQTQIDEKWSLILTKLSALEGNKGDDMSVMRESKDEDLRSVTVQTFAMPKVDFPEFDGSDLEDWLYKCQRFFELEHVPDNKKVKLASLYLYGTALQWHYSYVKNRKKDKMLEWEEYVLALNSRFGREVFEDPMGKMKNLKQEGEFSNLYAYMEEFDICLRRVLEKIELPMSFQVSLFINGLKEEFKSTLWLLKPTDLLSVQANVRILSGDVPPNRMGGSSKPMRIWNRPLVPMVEQRESSSMGNGNRVLPKVGNVPTMLGVNRYTGDRGVSTGTTSGSQGISSILGSGGRRRLSQEEVEERRLKGLCFGCNEPFDRNHRCSKRQVYSLVVEAVEEGKEFVNGVGLDMEEQRDDRVQVTLHALRGELHGGKIQTMQVSGLYKEKHLNILIDSGSTHNFVDLSLVKGMNLMVENVPPIKEVVADGRSMICRIFSDEIPVGRNRSGLGREEQSEITRLATSHHGKENAEML